MLLRCQKRMGGGGEDKNTYTKIANHNVLHHAEHQMNMKFGLTTFLLVVKSTIKNYKFYNVGSITQVDSLQQPRITADFVPSLIPPCIK